MCWEREMNWVRGRNRHHLYDGTKRLARIDKDPRRTKWLWSLDREPYTCGDAASLAEAKDAVDTALGGVTPQLPKAAT